MIGKRLKEIRISQGLTQMQISSVLEINQGNYSRLEKNNIEPNMPLLHKISKLYSVNLHWLLTGEGNMLLDSPDLPKVSFPVTHEMKEIPISAEISAGEPIEAIDHELGVVQVSSALPVESLVAFRVNGASMKPVVQHNDIVIINRDCLEDCYDNRIVAVRIDDGITLKKFVLDHESKNAWLFPFNLQYKPIKLNDNMDIRIIGVLDYLIRSFK